MSRIRRRFVVGLIAAAALLAGCGPSAAEPEASTSSTAAAAPAQIKSAGKTQNVSYGSPGMVAFTLTAGGAPIADAAATVELGDDRWSVTTDAGGEASVTIGTADLVAGRQQATITYAGDARYLAASGSVTIQVDPAAATVALTLTPAATGSTAVVAAVSTATGVDAAGTIDFTVDGAAVGSQPVAAGQASVDVAAGLSIGDHAVVATFSPARPKQIAAANGTGTLTISKAAATVTATGHSDTVRYGDHGTVNIAVQSSTPGVDLTGAVTLLDNGTVVVEGATDATGTASLDFLDTADPGAKSYTVSYAGNDVVSASEAQFTVQTTQTDVDFGIDKPTLKPGESGTITLSVIGTPQTPTGTAQISVDGVEIASGALDASGKISGQVTSVGAGGHDVAGVAHGDVRFAGDNGSSTLTVKQPIANPNSDGAAAIEASNPCPASAVACVDLSNTQAWLQSGGQVIYGPVSITSGRAGYRTPAGRFSAYWFDKDHKSTIYDDAPMPNSVFFNGGIAFHQGSLSVQSHGCIHLGGSASETFYDYLSVGDTVYVFGSAPY